MKFTGKVIKYGDNVDTDVIIPARYLNTSDHAELASHCMEDLDKDFTKKVEIGDIMVAGDNFGCGSSREHAPIAIKESGISLVVAKSFARIHIANLINFGIVPMTLVNETDYDRLSEGADIYIENFREAIKSSDKAVLINRDNGARVELLLNFTARQREILLAGGTLNYTKNNQ